MQPDDLPTLRADLDRLRYVFLRIDEMTETERLDVAEAVKAMDGRLSRYEAEASRFRDEVREDIRGLRADIRAVQDMLNQARGVVRVVTFLGLPGLAAILWFVSQQGKQ